MPKKIIEFPGPKEKEPEHIPDNQVQVHIEINISDFTDMQVDTLFKIEQLFRDIGISFDTGYDNMNEVRDWEWDWSLNGPIKVYLIGSGNEHKE